MVTTIVLYVALTTGIWQNYGDFTSVKTCKEAAMQMKLKSTQYKCLHK